MVQLFAVTGDRQWLDKYWDEIDTTKSQAKAVAELHRLGTPASELTLVTEASTNSQGLVKAEIRSMRLVLASENVPPEEMPSAVAAWQLSAEDAALPAAEKQRVARMLVFGKDYQSAVEKIMAPITEFTKQLTTRVDDQVAQAESYRDLSAKAMAACAGLLLATLVIVLVVIQRQLGSVIRRYAHQLRDTDPRDLTTRLHPAGVFELRELIEAFNAQNDTAAGVLRGVSEHARSLAEASERLTDTATRLDRCGAHTSHASREAAQRAESVSDSVSTVAAGTDEMSASIREIASAASYATGVAREAVESANQTSTTVEKLGESSALIGDVVKTITSLAEQTNLLALNATIEAARAGEAGKGFAVVASEVKDLAQQSAAATEDISRRVLSIQDDANATTTALAQITEVIGRIDETQGTIAAAVEEQTATTNEMSRSVRAAADASQGIADSIGKAAAAADDTSGGASRTLGSAQELSSLAQELQALVSGYRI